MSDALSLKVLIAEDEAPARAKVRRLLERDPDVTVICEARDGDAALLVIRDESPDIVLLDIEMPRRTGLEVISALPADAMPRVIFVTAYDAHAVQAFELAAVDYVLKPFDGQRFDIAMARAKRAIASTQRQDDFTKLLALLDQRASSSDRLRAKYVDRLPIEDGDRHVLVRTAEIDRFESDGRVVRVHVGGQVRRIRFTLVELEERLDPVHFARAGRSAIVNLDRVHSFEAAGHGDYILCMRDGSRVRLSRRYAGAVAGRLGLS